MSQANNVLPSRFLLVSCLLHFGTVSLFGSDMADLKARGEVIMLCSPHPRSDFIRRDGDGYFGLDYEILKAFAAAQEIRLKVQPVPKFSDLIPWLLAGKGDLIASSFSITDERREKVDFSESYFPVRIMVVAKRGGSIKSEKDLSGLQAAVVPGSSLEAFIRQKVPDVRLVSVDQTPRVYDAIVTGKSDYAPVDSSAALTYLKNHPDLETAFSFPDRFGYGFAVAKNSDIREALSQHVRRLRSTGVYYKMLQRTLGPEAIEVVKAAESQK